MYHEVPSDCATVMHFPLASTIALVMVLIMSDEPFFLWLIGQRKKLYMTQQQAADAFQVSKSTIQKWESGKIVPPAHTQAWTSKIIRELGGIPRE